MTTERKISIALFNGKEASQTRYTNSQIEIELNDIPEIITKSLWSPFKFEGACPQVS